METALTKEIKQELLLYYRYERSMYAVQECLAKDVLVCDKDFNRFTEFEIKVSASDLKAELKKDKHQKTGFQRPTYFYIVVPSKLRDEAVDIANQLNPKYGVMLYDIGFYTYKQAKSLGTVSNKLERALLNKMSSDYVKWYKQLVLYESDRLELDVTGKAGTIYRNLYKHYPRNIVDKFEYIASEDTIEYTTHRIKFLEKSYFIDNKRFKYSKFWIQNTMDYIQRWIYA
jgi:hypothetical protein